MAIAYGCTGPVLRGSGVIMDLRRDGDPCYTDMYADYQFEVIVQKNGHYPQDHVYPPVPSRAVLGDCWHRFYVRMLEVVQSMDIIRQAMDKYSRASGDAGTPIKFNHKLPAGEVYLETEAPKGQMGFYLVSDGTAIPWRARARSSCFCQPVGHFGALSRLPAGRCASHRRFVGYRVGRDRPVAVGRRCTVPRQLPSRARPHGGLLEIACMCHSWVV